MASSESWSVWLVEDVAGGGKMRKMIARGRIVMRFAMMV